VTSIFNPEAVIAIQGSAAYDRRAVLKNETGKTICHVSSRPSNSVFLIWNWVC